MPIRQTLTRTADAVISDDPNGKWFVLWNGAEGFDPFVALIRAEDASTAEEVWFENFPDRGDAETLVVKTAKSVQAVFDIEYPG